MSSTRSAREISDQITNTGTVHIRLLGPDTRHWCLQKSLLRHHSTYFHDVLSPNTLDETINDLEALRPGVLLPIVSASSSSIRSASAAAAAPFELFIQWIYTGNIDAVPTLANSDIDLDAQQLDIYIRLSCICADSYLNVPDLVSLALTRMSELYHMSRRREKNPSAFFFTAAHVEYIYTHTRPQSRLRDIALQASVYDFLNSTSAAMSASAETSVYDDDGKENDSSAEDDRGRRGRDEQDSYFYYPHQPSYAYMVHSATFSNDLLHAVRTYILSRGRITADNGPKHPFQIQQDLSSQFSSPLSSFQFPNAATPAPAPAAPAPAPAPAAPTKPTSPPKIPPPPPTPSIPSFAEPVPSPSSFVTSKREHEHEQGLGLELEPFKQSIISFSSSSSSSSSSLNPPRTETPPPPPLPTTPHKIGNSTSNSGKSKDVQDRERDGEAKLSVPVRGLLTPEATPTKKGPRSVSERLRKKSMGNWALDDANVVNTTSASASASAPASPPAMAMATTTIADAGPAHAVSIDVDAHTTPALAANPASTQNATAEDIITLATQNETTELATPIAVAVAVAAKAEGEGEGEGDTAENRKTCPKSSPATPKALIPPSSSSSIPDPKETTTTTMLKSSAAPTSMPTLGSGSGSGSGSAVAKVGMGMEAEKNDDDDGIL